ncbi:hypothetical protein PTKIN_Ptkin15bG0096100 [Pterospermum kingtungense]
MDTHRDRDECFHDHQPFNSTPWLPNDQRHNNFSADHHSHSYNHPIQAHHHHHHHQPSIDQNDAFCTNASNCRVKREQTKGNGLARLYVATIPRTVTEETIRSLFQEHGNVVEVIQPKDKKTDERPGIQLSFILLLVVVYFSMEVVRYCFVKYAMFKEADRAIKALHNQYTFPRELTTIKVTYADGERDRIVKKSFNIKGKEGNITFMLELGFKPQLLTSTKKEMALAAIKALNGIFTMKGCDQLLIVQFAKPKRPRNGEPRGSYASNSKIFGFHPRDLATRSMTNLGEPMAGCIPPNTSYSVQHISTNSQPQDVSHWANPDVTASHVTYQSYPSVQQAQSQLTSLPLQKIQTPQESSQSSQQAVS